MLLICNCEINSHCELWSFALFGFKKLISAEALIKKKILHFIYLVFFLKLQVVFIHHSLYSGDTTSLWVAIEDI